NFVATAPLMKVAANEHDQDCCGKNCEHHCDGHRGDRGDTDAPCALDGQGALRLKECLEIAPDALHHRFSGQELSLDYLRTHHLLRVLMPFLNVASDDWHSRPLLRIVDDKRVEVA